MSQRTRWPADLIVEALRLARTGESDRAIAAATGIPAHSVRTYRRRPPARAKRLLAGVPACAECGGDEHRFAELDSAAYAYLLGVYLGDGCLSTQGRTYQLRIALDSRYPGLVDEVGAAVRRHRGREPGRVHVPDSACVHLVVGWKQWACYFPQHGPGRKHERTIVLREWQRAHVEAAPEAFLRGLIHSDGCRTVNRFSTALPSGRIARYEYARYFFSNRSPDILALFSETCDVLGIRWTRSNHRNLSVSHRPSVARLDEFVGPKT